MNDVGLIWRHWQNPNCQWAISCVALLFRSFKIADKTQNAQQSILFRAAKNLINHGGARESISS
jgi:hypothetical protein